MKRLLIILTIGISFLPWVATAEKIDILKIFDDFIISAKAASLCMKPDESLNLKYVSNYTIIMPSVLAKIATLKPEWNEDKISQSVEFREDQLQSKTQSFVTKNGCDNDTIAELIKLYKFHANWDVLGS